MSLERSRSAFPPPRTHEARAVWQARDPSVLGRIGAPGIGAVVWQRDFLPEFRGWLEALDVERLPCLRGILAAGDVEGAVQGACDGAGLPRGWLRDRFADDVAGLAGAMAEVMRTQMLHVRLDVVRGDACRRFHVDNMTARLLCTYRGAGTQIAPHGQEHAPLDIAAGNAAILRGALWPGRETLGLLHRSPPIAGTGRVRLLLVVDPAFDHRPDGEVH